MKLTTGILYRTVSARTGSLRTALKPPDPIRLLLAWTVAGALLGAVLCRRMPQLAETPLLTMEEIAKHTGVRDPARHLSLMLKRGYLNADVLRLDEDRKTLHLSRR